MTPYRINHTTTYTYTEAVSLCQNVAHLAPRLCPRQRAEPSVLSITPDPAVIEEFVYDPRATTLTTPVAEVFANRRGVCQDFAHFQLACLRSLGLAARYVSGYLSTVPSPGKPRLVGADATHAWVSLFCGEAGWV